MKRLFIICVLLSGCIAEPKVQYVFEGVNIPEQFNTVPQIPLAPLADKFYTPTQVQQGYAHLTRTLCTMYLRYRELLRSSTNGNRVLPMITEDQCPYYFEE